MDTSSSSIAIVIPVRNRAGIVGRSLESVFAQTHRPIDLILVDNGSTDSTLDVLSEWKKAHETADFRITIMSESRPGASAARNAGFSVVSAPYVMFFDSDDEMRPDHVRRVAKSLAANPETDLLYYDEAIIDDDGWSEVKSVNDSDLLRGHLFHASLSTQRFTVASELLRAVGGWNEDLPTWNDLELGTRLALNAKRPHRLTGEPTVVVHPTDDSITGRGFAHRHEDCMRALDEIESALVSAGREHEIHYVESRRVILAAHLWREGEKELSRKIFLGVLNRSTVRDAIRMRLLFSIVRRVGRGATVAEWFFRPKRSTKVKV